MRIVVVAAALAGCSSIHLMAQQARVPDELERAAEEFKIQTRNLGLRAESPRRARQSSGGSAQFHGRLFENFRNDFLDAIPHEIRQRDSSKNLLRRNQFGFNVSGPVIIPKIFDGGRSTFFSVSYEGVRERIARSYLRTVPIVPERSGGYGQVVDYSGLPLRVFDPQTSRPNPNFDPAEPVTEQNLEYLRDPFPGDQMPAARLDPAAQKILSYYPLPNSNAGPYFRNNYFVISPETNKADGMIFKIDHSFLEKNRLSTSGSFTNGYAGSARFIPNAADSGPADRQYENRRLSAEHVYTASPKSVNTATVEAVADRSLNVSDEGDFASEIGLPGVPAGVFPSFHLGPYLPTGRANAIARNVRNTLVFTNAHALKFNKHNVRLVGQYARYQVNTFVPRYPSGSFQFTSGLTSLPGIVNTGHAFASFLLGGVESAQLSQVPSPSYFRASRWLAAAQDTWEIRPGLTFSFGASLAVFTPRTEKYDRQSTIDLSVINPANGRPGALIAANRNGVGRSFMSSQARLDPNASVAWNPRGSKKDIVRFGYAMSYQGIPVYSSQFGTQGFNGYSNFYSPNSQLASAFVLSGGLPPVKPLPDLRPEAANDTVADLIDRSGLLPRYQSASASYERELPLSFIVTGGFGVAWGKDLYLGNGGADPNAIPLENLKYRDSLNNIQFSRSLSPYPQFLGFNVFSSWPSGRYRRETVSVRVEKRLSQGLSMNAYYEFSRQEDDYSGPYGVQDYYNRKAEWGLTAYNSPHHLSLTYQYELPFGVNKPFMAYADWRRFLASGWAVSGISSVSSGEPLAIRPQFNNTGGLVQALRVNVVPGADPTVPDPGPDLWFNPDAFSHPADFTPGDGPRTHPALRNPTSQNHDLSLSKRFAIDRERTVELSAAGFNFLNHANWNDPDVVIGPAGSPNVNAGKIIGSRGGRVIQLGLRFSF